MGSGSSRRRGRAAETRELPQTAPAGTEGAAAAPAPGAGGIPEPRAGGIPEPRAGGIPEPRAGGSRGEWRGCGGGAPLQQAALSTKISSGPENNNADHQCPESNSKKPSGQSTISYDYSEEELMASIEREYCR